MKKICLISMAGVFLATGAVFAGAAFDSGSDIAYADGWQDQDNGGFGFSPWIFGGNASNRVAIGSSTNNGGSVSLSANNTSFLLSDSDDSGSFIDVFRYLATDLQVGETFALDMDVNFRAGFKGIRVRAADDTTSIFRFETGNPGSGDDYIVYDAASGNGSIGADYSEETQFRIALEQTSLTGGVWSITRSGGISDFDTGSYSGRVSSIQLFSVDAGSDAEQAMVVDNLEVDAPPAADNADDPAYADGWQDQDNGGYGFSAWIFGGNASNRCGIGSSLDNGGVSSIDVNSNAFFLSDADASGNYIDIFRFLVNDLEPGQTFSFDMDVNWRDGFKGAVVRDVNDASTLFKIEVGNDGLGDDYYVKDSASGNGSLGSDYFEDTQFFVELEQLTITNGIWSVTRSGGTNSVATGTYNGRVSSIQLFSFNGGSAAEQAVYYNNFGVEQGEIPVADWADDKAADGVYDDGWQDQDNGGFGFSPWVFGGNAGLSNRASIASSTGNGGDASINSGGRSFCLSDTDGSDSFIDVFRFIAGDLLPGQIFSLDMDVNWRGGYKGIVVRDADDATTLFKFEVGNDGAGDDYYVKDAASGNGSIGNAYFTDSQFHIALEQQTLSNGVWRVTRSGGTNSVSTGTYNGRVSSIQLFTLFGGADTEQAVYYNNLAINNTESFSYYDAWADSFGLLGGGEEGFEDDPDTDLLNNLSEYALGGNPTNADAAVVLPTYDFVDDMGTNWLLYIYNRRTDPATYGVGYQLKLTDDLLSGIWNTNGFTELPAAGIGGGFESVTNRIPTTNAIQFVTLEVEAL